MVTHLVTRREIPFDVPVVEAPTKDNVRASVDTLVTFNIVDPFKFVFSISADDFDQVFQAACQDGLRHLVRTIGAEQVADLAKQDLSRFHEELGAEMESYGVQISKITVTFAQPSADVMLSLEARQLASCATGRTGRETSAGAAPPEGSGRSGAAGSAGAHRARKGTAAVEDSKRAS